MEENDFHASKLISLFRIVDLYGWNESVANHISIKSCNDKSFYIINPKYRHFSRILADDLQKVKIGFDNPIPRDVDVTGWATHGAFHEFFPDVYCVVHLHPKYITIISSLMVSEIFPIDQVTARFYNRVSTYDEYSGMVDTFPESEKLVRAIKNNKVLIMRNHGVIAIGNTIEEVFDCVYHLERACRTLVHAYSTGQKLNVLAPTIAEKTAQSWEDDKELAISHFNEMVQISANRCR